MKAYVKGGELRISGSADELRPLVSCIFDVECDHFSSHQDEAAELAFGYWSLAYDERRGCGNIRGAWQVIMMASLGADALTGYDRLMPTDTAGEPLGLRCTPEQLCLMVDDLYEAMYAQEMVEEIDDEIVAKPWNLDRRDFPAGMRVAQAIWSEKCAACQVSGHRALAIAKVIDRIREPITLQVAA